ncbi:hypothetical protein LINGRAHAP2_LOCUS22840 [Linum grandiflorum]
MRDCPCFATTVESWAIY